MFRILKTGAAFCDGTAMALGLLVLAAALAAQGGRFSARLDVLGHFAPVWLLGALLAAGYGLAFASPSLKWTLAAVGGAGVLAAASLIAPEFTRPIRPDVAADVPRQIKLIQFNAWDQNSDVESTADWIAAQKPDLVLMQEVERPVREAMIRRGFHFVRGMARTSIFSRETPTFAPFVVPMGLWPRLPTFARASFPAEGGAFSVVSVHLDRPTEPGQVSQIAAFNELLAHYTPDRLIVAGDFNLTPWSFALRRLDAQFGLERRDRALFSWPARLSPGRGPTAPFAFLPIDHVYAGKAWRTVSIERGPRLGSDHYPVVARLALVD